MCFYRQRQQLHPVSQLLPVSHLPLSSCVIPAVGEAVVAAASYVTPASCVTPALEQLCHVSHLHLDSINRVPHYKKVYSFIMDATPELSYCFHLNVKSCYMRDFEKLTKEYKELQKKTYQIEEDMEKIEDFVSHHEDDIPDTIYELIHLKDLDLMEIRNQLYQDMDALDVKLTKIQTDLIELEASAQNDHCYCTGSNN